MLRRLVRWPVKVLARFDICDDVPGELEVGSGVHMAPNEALEQHDAKREYVSRHLLLFTTSGTMLTGVPIPLVNVMFVIIMLMFTFLELPKSVSFALTSMT